MFSSKLSEAMRCGMILGVCIDKPALKYTCAAIFAHFRGRPGFMIPQLIACILTIQDAPADRVLANSDCIRSNMIEQALEQLYVEEYDSALVTCQRLQHVVPDDPIASLLQLNIYQAQMRAYRVRIFESKLDSLITQAIEQADRKAKNTQSAVMLFMQGSPRSILALHSFRQGEWAKAITALTHSLHYMKKSLMKDHSFVDPKLSLGFYKYYQYKMLNLGLGLRKSAYNEATSLILEVWEKGRYLSTDAGFALQNMYLHESDYSKALEVNDWLTERTPNHPSILYHRALLMQSLQRPQVALDCWLALIGRLQSYRMQSHGYLAECYLHVTQIYESMNAIVHRQEINQAIALARQHSALRNPELELESSFQKPDDIDKEIQKLCKKYCSADQ